MSSLLLAFGNRVKTLRKHYGISQEVLSEKTGITRENISIIENGLSAITLTTLEKIANAFNISIKDLMDFPIEQSEKKKGIKPHPFVKWAGGKTQILDKLLEYVPETFGTYYEPFVGGGALFLTLTPKKAVINDLNEELMSAFKCFKSNTAFESLKALLKKYEEEHSEENYYIVRSMDRDESYKNLSDAEKASRMIYLNKACFNGLYRVNSSGFFNVPSGKKEKVKTFEEGNFESIKDYFASSDIKILSTSFKDAVKGAKEGDFIYFDPPYDKIENKESFTSYSKENFSKEDQGELSEVFKALDKKNVKVMLSNHNTEFIRELYKDYNIHVITAKRMINSKASGRGPVEEVIITNY